MPLVDPDTHFVTYSSHHDVDTACGISAWHWDGKTDDPDVFTVDVGNVQDAVKVTSEPGKVTCAVCKPTSDATAARRAEMHARVEAAGGMQAMIAKLKARTEG